MTMDLEQRLLSALAELVEATPRNQIAAQLGIDAATLEAWIEGTEPISALDLWRIASSTGHSLQNLADILEPPAPLPPALKVLEGELEELLPRLEDS